MNIVLKQLVSLILPFTIIIVIPYLILSVITLPGTKSPDNLTTIGFVMGLLFVIIGLTGLALTIWMFIKIGKGTLAPWSPTKRLIISGPYAHLRNPMISSVLFVLLGEVLIFESWKLLAWLTICFAINHAYFILVEEPGLAKRFGKEYCDYKQNVPRWIPRIMPWRPTE